mgnify:CR=1 FL=1
MVEYFGWVKEGCVVTRSVGKRVADERAERAKLELRKQAG